MKKILFSLAAVAALLGMVSCSTESVEVPVITDLGITANPVDCQVYNRGDSIYIPANAQPGDYHFVIRATNSQGGQGIRAMAIKIK